MLVGVGYLVSSQPLIPYSWRVVVASTAESRQIKLGEAEDEDVYKRKNIVVLRCLLRRSAWPLLFVQTFSDRDMNVFLRVRPNISKICP